MNSLSSVPVMSGGQVIQIDGQLLTLSNIPSSLSVNSFGDGAVHTQTVQSITGGALTNSLQSAPPAGVTIATSSLPSDIDTTDNLPLQGIQQTLQLPPGSILTLDTGQVIQVPGLDVLPLSVTLDQFGVTQQVLLEQGEDGEFFLCGEDVLQVAEESNSQQSPEERRKPGRPKKHESRVEKPIGRGPFTCDICNQKIALWGAYRNHKKSHNLDRKFRCSECGASFNIEKNLLLHIAGHQTGDSLACPECNKVFSRIASLRSHLAIHEEEDNLVCSSCGDEFPNQLYLDKHISKAHATKRLKPKTDSGVTLSGPLLDTLVTKRSSWFCKTCDKDLETFKAYREHLLQHKKLKNSLELRRKVNRKISRDRFNYKCTYCGKKFSKPSQVKRHERVHTGEKPFKCKDCGKAFNQRNALETHQIKHTGQKPYACSFCPIRFNQRGNLHAHIKKLHSLGNDGKEKFKCHHCTCVFHKVGSLHSHLSRYHPEDKSRKVEEKSTDKTNFLLEEPPTINSREWELQFEDNEGELLNEAVKETGTVIEERRKDAEVPGDGEAGENTDKSNNPQTDLLSRALESAMNQPEVITDESSKDFIVLADKSYEGKMRKHLVRTKVDETGLVMYYCNWCARGFKKPSDLVRHIRTHTKEKPFQCPHCSRAFSVKSSLSSHLRIHQNQKLACDLCQKVFFTISALKTHKKTVHSISVMEEGEPGSRVGDTAKIYKNQEASVQMENPPNLIGPPANVEPLLLTSRGIIQNPRRYENVYNTSEREAGLRNHPCTFCSASFKKSSHLKQHIRSHTGEKPYMCFKCNKRFLSRGSLNMHIKSHNREKMYQCGVCDTSFTTPGSVRRHMTKHQEDKPFLCPVCNKAFKSRVMCKKHIRIHGRHELENKKKAAARSQNDADVLVQSGTELGPTSAAALEIQSFEAPRLGLEQEFGVEAGQESDLYSSATAARSSQTFVFDPGFSQLERESAGIGLENGPASGAVISTTNLSLDHAEGLPRGQADHSTHVKPGTQLDDPSESRVLEYESTLKTVRIPINSSILQHAVIDPDPKKGVISLNAADIGLDVPQLNLTSQLSDVNVEVSLPNVSESLSLSSMLPSAASTRDTFLQPERREVQSSQVYPVMQQQLHDVQTDVNNTQPYLVNVADSNSNLSELLQPSMPSIDPSFINQDQGGKFTLDSDTSGIAHNLEKSGSGQLDHAGKWTENTSVLNVREDKISSAGEKSSTAASGLDRMYYEIYESAPWRCRFCDIELDDVDEISKHAATHEPHTEILEKEQESTRRGSVRFKCGECGDVFANGTELQSHKKSHVSQTQTFTCDVCKGNFSTKSSFLRHQNVHSNRPHQCGHAHCGIKFKTLSALNKHNINEHGGDPGEFMDAELRRRMASHIKFTDEETRELALTPKKKAKTISERLLLDCATEKLAESNLDHDDSPKAVHVNKCGQCDRSFKKPSDLTRHIRTHTGEKPYACTKCDKSFSVKSTLNNHMKIHTGSKSIACHVCHSLFSGKHSLKVHMRLHTGHLPYKCQLCDECFRTPFARKVHIESHFRLQKEEASAEATRGTELQPSSDLVPLTISAESLSAALEAVSSSGAPLEGATVQLQLHGNGFQSAVAQLHINQDVLEQLRRGENININISNRQLTKGEKLIKEQENVGLETLFDGYPCVDQSETKHADSNCSTVNYNSSKKSAGSRRDAQLIHQAQLISESYLIETGGGGQILVQEQQKPQKLEEYSHTAALPKTQSELSSSVDSFSGGQLVTKFNETVESQQLGVFHADKGSAQTALARIDTGDKGAQRVGDFSVGVDSDLKLEVLQGQGIDVLDDMGIAQVYICPWCDRMFPSENERISHLLSDHGVEVREDLEVKPKDDLGSSKDGNRKLKGDLMEIRLQSEAVQVMSLPESSQLPNISLQEEAGINLQDCSQIQMQDTNHLTLQGTSHISLQDSSELNIEDTQGAGQIPLETERISSFRMDNSHICTVCNKSFRKPSLLKRHMRVHTGERPYICDLCNKGFNQKNALQTHLRKHAGDRPYVCEYCLYPFSQKGNLKMHIQRSHIFDQKPAE